jgi:hypothetical protein
MNAFPRKRLVKACTKRFRGNVRDLVASAITIRADKGADDQAVPGRRPEAELERLAEYCDTHDTSAEMEPGHWVEPQPMATTSLRLPVEVIEELKRQAAYAPWSWYRIHAMPQCLVSSSRSRSLPGIAA